MNGYAAILFLVGLAFLVWIVDFICSRPKPPNPEIKGLGMHHWDWEGPDR